MFKIEGQLMTLGGRNLHNMSGKAGNSFYTKSLEQARCWLADGTVAEPGRGRFDVYYKHI